MIKIRRIHSKADNTPGWEDVDYPRVFFGDFENKTGPVDVTDLQLFHEDGKFVRTYRHIYTADMFEIVP